MLDNPDEVCYSEGSTVACPRCGTECQLAPEAEFFRCLKCYHEAPGTDAEVLD